MPRSSAPEVPWSQSQRGSLQLRTSSCDSDSSHHRPLTDQSPKLRDRRSPMDAQSDSFNQKKLGTRIAGLESQLGQAQEELKSLKEHLASVEAAKKEAQEQLQKKAKKKTVLERHPRRKSNTRNSNVSNVENHKETDVFEVPIEREELKPQIEVLESVCDAEKTTEAMEISAQPSPVFVEPEKEPLDELAAKGEEIDLLKSRLEEKVDEIAAKGEEIDLLKSRLEEKEKELEAAGQEKDSMKKQLDEVNDMLALARTKEEEASKMFTKLENEIVASQEDNHNLKTKLGLVEGEKEALETEMKKLRVQTEQWRKAADAAAALLSGGVDTDGRVPGRCGSMGKHFNGVFKVSDAGYVGYEGSPGNADDTDDGYEGGRRKNSGIRMFGDLWKKKGQK